ncbi:MAG: DUF4097 family beta strand repeat protein [Bdellovibrionaceae bacterium]|nr:DUF4097 family beta strand repeat protein [Pseudobdellovibrionaceae bacterium]
MKLVLIATLLATSVALANPEVKEFDSAGLVEVKVENMSGLVSVSTGEGNKAIVSATKNKFSDKCKMTIEKVDRKLLVKVEKSGIFSTGDCDVNFEIKTPKSVNVDVSSRSGDLKVTGTQGKLDFKIGSGNVLADGEFKNLDGKSGSGDVTVKGLSGGGELKTGSGAITLTFATSKLNGSIDIKSGSGNATLLFPKGSLVMTNYKAGSGEMTNELGDNPKAEFKISMKAGSGDLKIKTY